MSCIKASKRSWEVHNPIRCSTECAVPSSLPVPFSESKALKLNSGLKQPAFDREREKERERERGGGGKGREGHREKLCSTVACVYKVFFRGRCVFWDEARHLQLATFPSSTALKVKIRVLHVAGLFLNATLTGPACSQIMTPSAKSNP